MLALAVTTASVEHHVDRVAASEVVCRRRTTGGEEGRVAQ